MACLVITRRNRRHRLRPRRRNRNRPTSLRKKRSRNDGKPNRFWIYRKGAQKMSAFFACETESKLQTGFISLIIPVLPASSALRNFAFRLGLIQVAR